MNDLHHENLKIQRVFVKTNFPIAHHSLDHLVPLGTAVDKSKNHMFNQRLYRLFAPFQRFIRVLDLGCSGGTFVRSCLDDGCIAVGIEGSDYSQKFLRAEWGTLNDRFLFTADITKPFEVKAIDSENEKSFKFDVVTAWEVMEHIEEKDFEVLFQNISKHLLPSGIVILSISAEDSFNHGVNLHLTKQSKRWWIDRAQKQGLFHMPELERYFSPQYVRGPRREKAKAFHLILALNPDLAPKRPKETILHQLYQQWMGSVAQKFLKKMLVPN